MRYIFKGKSSRILGRIIYFKWYRTWGEMKQMTWGEMKQHKWGELKQNIPLE